MSQRSFSGNVLTLFEDHVPRKRAQWKAVDYYLRSPFEIRTVDSFGPANATINHGNIYYCGQYICIIWNMAYRCVNSVFVHCIVHTRFICVQYVLRIRVVRVKANVHSWMLSKGKPRKLSSSRIHYVIIISVGGAGSVCAQYSRNYVCTIHRLILPAVAVAFRRPNQSVDSRCWRARKIPQPKAIVLRV